jgi:hypothetical protein
MIRYSFGIELLPVPAHCARLQLRETQRRWAMWGLNGNLDVEFAEGDFRTHPAVPKRLREADVVVSRILFKIEEVDAVVLILSSSTTRSSHQASMQTLPTCSSTSRRVR